MSTSTRTFAAGLALLLLAGCTGGDGDETASSSTTTTAVDAPEIDADGDGNPFVQDLWIYERLRTVDARGEIVDHTERLVEAVSGFEAAEAVELVPGMDFVPVPEVGAHLKGPDADPRTDAGAVAGLVENEIGTAFAVLGTVDPDGERQIGLDDRVFADMSFLGDAIGLDDVVSADVVLVQLSPTGDTLELELGAVDLAAHRAEAEALQFTADADVDVVLLSGQLGRIVAGSEGPELPVKSWDDMADGFRGLRKCRSHALKCVSSFFDSFGDGATKNFDQNMDQLDPDPPDEPFNPLLHLPME